MIDIMTAREWLLRNRHLKQYINQLEESKKNKLVKKRSRNISSRETEQYTELDEEIDRQIEELKKVRYEIITTVKKVRDNTLSALLIGHYINNKSIPELAESLNYSERQIVRLHKKALEEIKIITGCD